MLIGAGGGFTARRVRKLGIGKGRKSCTPDIRVAGPTGSQKEVPLASSCADHDDAYAPSATVFGKPHGRTGKPGAREDHECWPTGTPRRPTACRGGTSGRSLCSRSLPVGGDQKFPPLPNTRAEVRWRPSAPCIRRRAGRSISDLTPPKFRQEPKTEPTRAGIRYPCGVDEKVPPVGWLCW